MSECIICTNKINNSKNNKISCNNGCTSYYHFKCFLKSGNNCCPLCRSEVKTNLKIDKIQNKYKLNYMINEIKYNNPILSQVKNENIMQILKINDKN